MRTTRALQELIDLDGDSPGLEASVRSLLETDFTLSEGCLLLTGRFEKNRHLRLNQFEDRVAFECAMNEVTVATGHTPAQLATLLLEAVEILRVELLTASPPGNVRVIGAVDMEPTRTATIRFYMREPGERTWIDFEDADQSGRAILIVDFD